MSDLKEILAARNEKRAKCVDSEYQPVPMVTLCAWQGKEWSLPWSRLDAICFGDQEEAERLELFFPHHHVVMIGVNLRQKLQDLRDFKVVFVRNFPDSHRINFRPEEPFISELEVRALGSEKHQAQASLPF